jgi:hypothetical protein
MPWGWIDSTINFRTFPPLDKPNVKNVSIDFYIRLISTLDGKPMGASNVVVAHYVPTSDSSLETTKAVMRAAEEAKKKYAEMAEAAKVFQAVDLRGPQPFGVRRGDQEPVLRQPHAQARPLQAGQVYCPDVYTGDSYQAKNIGDVLSGWVKAYAGSPAP